jgi:hypothetical protein
MAGVMVEVEAAEELGTGDGLGSGLDGMLLKLVSGMQDRVCNRETRQRSLKRCHECQESKRTRDDVRATVSGPPDETERYSCERPDFLAQMTARLGAMCTTGRREWYRGDLGSSEDRNSPSNRDWRSDRRRIVLIRRSIRCIGVLTIKSLLAFRSVDFSSSPSAWPGVLAR